MQQLQALAARVQQLEQQVAAQKQATPAALEQKVQELEHKLAEAEKRSAAPAAPAPVASAGEKGFGIKGPEGDFEVKLRGLVQADARVFDSGIKGRHTYVGDSAADQALAEAGTDSAVDNILMRRVRPTIEGTVFGQYGFRFTPEFGNNSSSVVDAYIDGNFDPAFKLRLGKFTPSLAIERSQSSADTKFNELSLVSDFIPSRDIGLQLSGELFGKTLDYSLGLMNGAADAATGDLDANSDKELQARLFTRPFANDKDSALQGLGFGVAATHVDARGGSANPTSASGLSARANELPTYRSIGQEAFFNYRSDKDETDTVYADGRRTRLIPQFHYFADNFGLLGEYLEETQELTRVKNATRRNEALEHEAWQLTAAWTLTGEAQSLKGITPAHNFSSTGDGWGAWELVARWSTLELDKDAFEINGALPAKAGADYGNTFAEATRSAQSADNWGVGVNWYLNRMLRVSLDYDQTRFNWGGGGSSTAPDDREDERVLIGRVQAAF